ncbi:MAG: dihydroorotate dehydrogenase electron transfer subunit [Candidatus Eisenbacteria bacterium]
MTYCSIAKIVDNEQLRNGYYTLRLEAPSIAGNCAPGQFIMLRGLVAGWPYLRRPFSVYSSDGESMVDIIYKVVGRATSIMSQMDAGGEFDVVGPLGEGFTPNETCTHAIAVAGGMGLPPIAFYCQKYVDLYEHVTLVVGAATREELLVPVGLVVQGVKIATYTEDGSKGSRGTALDGLAGAIGEMAMEQDAVQVVACGPREMLFEIARLCRERNVSCQVSVDEIMACGIGACLSCAVPAAKGGYHHACKDGPVFDSGLIDWERWLDT